MSLKSLKIFSYINFPILCFSLLQSTILNSIQEYLILPSLFLFEFSKNISISLIMNNYVDKPTLHIQNPKSLYEYILITQSFISSSIIKTLTHYFILDNFIHYDYEFNSIFNIFLFYLMFIGKSFLFELTFDFLHYWTHRIFHSNKYIYIYIHKKHHKYPHPTPFTTFYMSIPDILLGYSLPLIISSYLLKSLTTFTYFDFTLICTYLTYQEIGGHIGKKMYPTSSFPQFIWFPKLFGIELYTEEHDLHHQKLHCNFSKRFSLWDKAFNTYQKPY